MKKKKNSNALGFFITMFIVLAIGAIWSMTRKEPIEVTVIDWSHLPRSSIVRFEVTNNSPTKEKALIKIFAEISWSSEDGVGSRKIKSKEFEIELFSEETKKITETLDYEQGIKFNNSRIVVEGYELTYNQAAHSTAANARLLHDEFSQINHPKHGGQA
ncbi:hypothetical protein [Pelagicoccus sp. SDUM812005]|uniref:hypothetical protein n=1 Tax=Pelagicoccus sp. SDUM812005 TaxID=3041257 RepID=UPI0028104B57|nr:hypothetical protein [Pelagicoccus sp. SDUM812005]MDQ8183868.1 hypothetical protein [Pelagicoccus sp. SDUM812005]